jgi:hypothetical protein
MKKKKLLKEIRKRQSRWLDQVIVEGGMMKAVTEGRMFGKMGRERKRKGFLDGMKDI